MDDPSSRLSSLPSDGLRLYLTFLPTVNRDDLLVLTDVTKLIQVIRIELNRDIK